MCACTIDNPRAKARGLSLRTGAQTMLYLSHVLCHNNGCDYRYFGSIIFSFKNTLTTTLNHKTCTRFLKKTLFAINANFTKDKYLSKNESRGGGLCRKQSLHARNVILSYLHRARRNSSSQSHSAILSDKSKFLLSISFCPKQCLPMVPC